MYVCSDWSITYYGMMQDFLGPAISQASDIPAILSTVHTCDPKWQVQCCHGDVVHARFSTSMSVMVLRQGVR